jgi:hypothetical protein
MKFFRIFGRSVRDAFKSVGRNFSLSLASITCITITLVIVGLSLIISKNVNAITHELESELEIVAFVSNDADDFDLQSEESVVQVWQGQGGINIGLNLSDENEFILEVNQMDEDSIEGRLDVTAVDGTSYSRDFTGTGRPAEMLHAGSTFYDITLDEEIAGWSDDYAGYKEFTLRYQPEEDQFYFDTGPFEAVLKRNKKFFKK